MAMLVDVRSAAKELGGIGESTLRRMIGRGLVPVVRIGRRVLIEREALSQIVERSVENLDTIRAVVTPSHPSGPTAKARRHGTNQATLR